MHDNGWANEQDRNGSYAPVPRKKGQGEADVGLHILRWARLSSDYASARVLKTYKIMGFISSGELHTIGIDRNLTVL